MEYKFLKMYKRHLKQMREIGKRTIDIRVPDPSDKEKVYYDLKKGHPLHFEDTSGEILKAKVDFIRHYKTPEELLLNEGIENVWPEIISEKKSSDEILEEAIKKCLQFHGYEERVKDNGIYAIGIKRLLIYVAGPYTPVNYTTEEEKEIELKKNITLANNVGFDVASLGYVSQTPHKQMEGWETRNWGYTECLEYCVKWWVPECDGLVFIAPSNGTNKERKKACSLKIPIFQYLKDAKDPLENLRFWRPANYVFLR